MELSKLLLPFFLLSTIMAKKEDKCLPGGFKCAFDYSDQLIIDFPFSYEGCSYPGFNISCNEENKASIQIGTWGKFSVRGVNFFKQEVQIYDQHNCLPKRLLSLDLSGSPFTGAHYEKFTFYNCSSEFSSNVSKPISCLSTRSHTIFASSNSSTAEIFSKCDVIASVMVPSKSGSKTDISKNIHLIWDTPDCRACLRHDGQCVLKKKGSTEITCVLPSLAPKSGKPLLSNI
ncbi:hypothetical protein ACHQM5_006011 [Ranunculus cassubicifolius]